MTEIDKLKAWTKTFTVEQNGLRAVGFSTGYSWINVEFMDNDRGVWVIMCTYDCYPEGRKGINMGTYVTIKRVKELLDALGAEYEPKKPGRPEKCIDCNYHVDEFEAAPPEYFCSLLLVYKMNAELPPPGDCPLEKI